jgi:glycosyltransferase involved in cell wall biosynthesis
MNLDILLPAHVHNRFLDEAIESCLREISDTVRIILIDTTGNSSLREFGNRNQIMHLNLPNASDMEALAFGLKHTEAEFVALMNSDDLISELRFKVQVKVLETKHADLVFAKIVKFQGTPDKVLPSLLGNLEPSMFVDSSLLLGSYGADASWVFRRSWAIENNLFADSRDESDWQLAMRTFPTSRIVGVDLPLYFYRMHSNQVTRKSHLNQGEFLNSWRTLNRVYGFKDLTDNEIFAISKTFLLRPGSKLNFNNLYQWRTDFLKSLRPADRFAYDELIKRRFVLTQLITLRSGGFKNNLRVLRNLALEAFKLRSMIRL